MRWIATFIGNSEQITVELIRRAFQREHVNSRAITPCCRRPVSLLHKFWFVPAPAIKWRGCLHRYEMNEPAIFSLKTNHRDRLPVPEKCFAAEALQSLQLFRQLLERRRSVRVQPGNKLAWVIRLRIELCVALNECGNLTERVRLPSDQTRSRRFTQHQRSRN